MVTKREACKHPPCLLGDDSSLNNNNIFILFLFLFYSWSFHYFFYNKKKKRIIFVTCRAVSMNVYRANDGSLSDDEDYDMDIGFDQPVSSVFSFALHSHPFRN